MSLRLANDMSRGPMSNDVLRSFSGNGAEEVGFEPTLPVKINQISNLAPSTTRPLLRF